MKDLNPQELKIQFLKQKADEFKAFLIQSVEEGMSDEVNDHFVFMEMALEAFIEIQEGE